MTEIIRVSMKNELSAASLPQNGLLHHDGDVFRALNRLMSLDAEKELVSIHK